MENKIIIKDVSDFSIEQIADSGQAFRWNKNDHGGYIGVVFGKVINVSQESNDIIVKGNDIDEISSRFNDYFDLDRDYGEIKQFLRTKDIHLESAIAYGDGIRILNQDLWEMIISFIISGNNNIPRIKKSIELISEKYGNFIEEINGIKYYSFPTPEELSVASIENLRGCGVGYRDSYIFKTTKLIVSKEVDLDLVKTMKIDDARKELKKLVGVGDKVADCIMLFSCRQTGAFPIDTWVKKILTSYYGLEKTSFKAVYEFANSYFGKHSGIAQQYLFYYIRSNS